MKVFRFKNALKMVGDQETYIKIKTIETLIHTVYKPLNYNGNHSLCT
jgi:hypothetical protein